MKTRFTRPTKRLGSGISALKSDAEAAKYTEYAEEVKRKLSRRLEDGLKRRLVHWLLPDVSFYTRIPFVGVIIYVFFFGHLRCGLELAC